jgi:hypothetical protein
VEILKLPVKPTEKDKLVFLDYRQLKCDDGVLNYKCEYQMEFDYYMNGKWFKAPAVKGLKDSFVHSLLVPEEAVNLRVRLAETDDGQISDQGQFDLPLEDGRGFFLQAPKKTYKGNMVLHIRSMAPWLKRQSDVLPVAIDYFEKTCYDGALNYKCEYQVEVEIMRGNGKPEKLIGEARTRKGSFSVYSQVPKDTSKVKVTIKEMDESEVSAQDQVLLDLEHGSSMQVDSGDGTFLGEIKLKFLDYDEESQSSEAEPDFVPHDQRNREEKKWKDLRRP